MAKYKIFVTIDEQNKFWIVVNNGKFIRNPTEEDIKGTKVLYYNQTNICPICRKEYKIDGKKLTNKSILYPKNARHDTDKDGNKTEEYACYRHGNGNYERYAPNSQHNIQKALRNRRTGNVGPKTNQAKGDRGEELLCQWKGYTNLNKKFDKYTRNPIDCFNDKTGEYYQVKVAYYDSINRRWGQNFLGIEFGFRSLFLFCISEDGQTVERGYDIPEKEVINVTGITITKYAKSGLLYENEQHEKNRITDEKELKKINEIWKNILEEQKQ